MPGVIKKTTFKFVDHQLSQLFALRSFSQKIHFMVRLATKNKTGAYIKTIPILFNTLRVLL